MLGGKAEYQGFTFTDADVANPDDFIPDATYNPHKIRPWLIYEQVGYSAVVRAIVFASCEQDALDEAVNYDKLDHLMLDENNPEHRADYTKETTYDGGEPFMDWDEDRVTFLGNASEPFDLEGVGLLELPNPPFSWVALFNAMELPNKPVDAT
jgi:hypothetical protein